MRLLRENANTEYGRKYDFASIRSIAEYKAKVPMSSYDDCAPYMERMLHNREENLLTAAPTVHYALS